MRHLSTLSFCAFTGILLAAPAHAESLADRIQSINSGTHQGVVIYKDKSDDAAAPATNPDGTPVEKPTGWRALFSKLPPPGGASFADVRSGRKSGDGIVLQSSSNPDKPLNRGGPPNSTMPEVAPPADQ